MLLFSLVILILSPIILCNGISDSPTNVINYGNNYTNESQWPLNANPIINYQASEPEPEPAPVVSNINSILVRKIRQVPTQGKTTKIIIIPIQNNTSPLLNSTSKSKESGTKPRNNNENVTLSESTKTGRGVTKIQPPGNTTHDLLNGTLSDANVTQQNGTEFLNSTTSNGTQAGKDGKGILFGIGIKTVSAVLTHVHRKVTISIFAGASLLAHLNRVQRNILDQMVGINNMCLTQLISYKMRTKLEIFEFFRIHLQRIQLNQYKVKIQYTAYGLAKQKVCFQLLLQQLQDQMATLSQEEFYIQVELMLQNLPTSYFGTMDVNGASQEEEEKWEREESERREREESEKRGKEESERRIQEEAENKKKGEADKKLKDDADRKKKAEDEKKKKDEADRKKKADEEKKKKDEADRKKKADEEKKKKDEADRKKKADEEKKKKDEADRKKKADEEKKKKDEADRKKKEEAERKKKEEQSKKQQSIKIESQKTSTSETTTIKLQQEIQKIKSSSGVGKYTKIQVQAEKMKYLTCTKMTQSETLKIETSTKSEKYEKITQQVKTVSKEYDKMLAQVAQMKKDMEKQKAESVRIQKEYSSMKSELAKTNEESRILEKETRTLMTETSSSTTTSKWEATLCSTESWTVLEAIKKAEEKAKEQRDTLTSSSSSSGGGKNDGGDDGGDLDCDLDFQGRGVTKITEKNKKENSVKANNNSKSKIKRNEVSKETYADRLERCKKSRERTVEKDNSKLESSKTVEKEKKVSVATSVVAINNRGNKKTTKKPAPAKKSDKAKG